MSEDGSDEGRATFNRRNVLQATGVTVAGGFVPGTATAEGRNPDGGGGPPGDGQRGPREPDVKVVDHYGASGQVTITYSAVDVERIPRPQGTSVGQRPFAVQREPTETLGRDRIPMGVSTASDGGRPSIDRIGVGSNEQLAVEVSHGSQTDTTYFGVTDDGGVRDNSVMVHIDSDGELSATTIVSCRV
jgi:hypothetical protein